MPFDRFLIAPSKSGMQTDLKPWLIPEDSFELLQDMYVFRGRVRKRFGSEYMGTTAATPQSAQLLSRLRIQVGTTSNTGGATGSIPAGTLVGVGQSFSIGTEIFTVNVLGTPAVMLTTGASTTYTFNTTTGAFVFAGSAHNTAIYFYPNLPVMGLCQYDIGYINNQPSFAFDLQYAYTYSNAAGWQWSNTAGQPVFHGNNYQFFWTANWRGVSADQPPTLFVTNFNAQNPPADTDDPMWYYSDGTWTPWNPIFNAAGAFIMTAAIIIPFKNRLVLLNTVENNGDSPYADSTNTFYVQRCRFSAVGSPFDTYAWYENSGEGSTGGGFIDAPTLERIISAELIKDRLIVYFDRSTWELAYTGNQVLPFVWNKINTELGSEARFSTVPFDKQVLTIGSTGVHSCNGANVSRIDDKIPDEIYEISSASEGIRRIIGIRDYYVECVYWAFPTDTNIPNQFYPNRVLVYNYKNDSWGIFLDTITMFGYFEQQLTSVWEDVQYVWEEYAQPWQSGTIETNFRQVIAGNQQGYVFIISPDLSRNAAVLYITNLTFAGQGFVLLNVTNHNLAVGQYVSVENAGNIMPTIGIYAITQLVDANNFYIYAPNMAVIIAGPYTGGGTCSIVSNPIIRTKQWNPYVNQGKDVYLAKIDFGVTNSEVGQVTVDYMPSSAENLSMITAGTAEGSIMGTSVLETGPYATVPIEQYQDTLWHQIYFQTEGESIQLYITMTYDQITNTAIAWADFQIEGMVLHTMPTTQRLQ